MDKAKFRRDIMTLKAAKRRKEIHKKTKGEKEVNEFKKERIVDFQCREWRGGRKLMK